MENTVSKHAIKRNSQRGIRMSDLYLLMKYADLISPVGNGCSSYMLGSEGFKAAATSGMSLQVADRIKRMSAVVSSTGHIITTMKVNKKRRKRYNGYKMCRRDKPRQPRIYQDSNGEVHWVM
jgi:hypothetical protein